MRRAIRLPAEAWPALAAGAAAAAAPLLPFVYDDLPLIRDNPGLGRLGSLAQLAGPRYYAEFGVGNYHPLTLALWAALRAAVGPAPAAFHLVSAALHVANAWAACRLLRAAGVRGWAAAAGAALWAASPLHAQTLFVAAFQSDLLCSAFCLWACARALETPRDPLTDAGGYALLAFALLSKETAAALPAALWLLGPWPAARYRGQLYLLAAYAALRLGAVGDLEMIAATPVAAGVEPGWAVLTRAAEAARLSAWAWPPSLWREDPGRAALGPALLAALALWAGAAAAADRRARLLALGWAALWLLPFLNLAPVGHARAYFAGRFLNERYLYLSSLGLAWLLASGASRLGGRAASAARAAALAACASGAVALGVESRRFADDVALWTRAVQAAPRSLWPRNILGVALLGRDRPSEALEQFDAALGLRKGSAWERSVTWANRAAALERLGRREESERAYLHAAAADPRNPEAARHAARIRRDRAR